MYEWLWQPEDDERTQPPAEEIELAAQVGWAEVQAAMENGWIGVLSGVYRNVHSLGRLALLRGKRVLSELNALLLLPLSVLIAIEMFSPRLPGVVRLELETASFAIAIAFLSEWLAGLALATNRAAYLKNGWLLLDLGSSVPMSTALQWLRIARLARLFRLMKLVRFFRGRSRHVPVGRILRAMGVTASIMVSGAVALQAMEPELALDFGDALWWASVTMSTVGYGDIVPVSPFGRTVGVCLMMAGVGVFSYLAGAMASTMFDEEEEETLMSVRRLEHRIAELTTLVQQAAANSTGGGPEDER